MRALIRWSVCKTATLLAANYVKKQLVSAGNLLTTGLPSQHSSRIQLQFVVLTILLSLF